MEYANASPSPTIESPDVVPSIVKLPVDMTVPVTSGNVIVLSAVGSATVKKVSYAFAKKPSNTKSAPFSVIFTLDMAPFWTISLRLAEPAPPTSLTTPATAELTEFEILKST